MNWASTSGAAVPVVISEGSKHGSYQDVSAFQMNTVSQSANGGGAAVIGKAHKRDELEQRTCWSPPSSPTVSNNNGNTVVSGQAIGGSEYSFFMRV